MTEDNDDGFNPVQRLTRDLRTAAATLSDDEARFMVDHYYQMQENRIRAGGQLRSIKDEPHEVLTWFEEQAATLENQVRRALDQYTQGHPMGEWMRGIFGIGPVISAGLLAHIDIYKAPTVGHIWRFAGLDPTVTWNKGEKRPWNAALKVICFHAGESFVKFSNNPKCYYGHKWKERKVIEERRNEAGELAEQAAEKLRRFRIRKETDAYKWYSSGKLPPAHIHARAKRWAVKLFLSHLHGEMYRTILKTEPPLPYPIAFMNHTHFIPPPSAV